PRRTGDFRHRTVECGLIGLRGLVEAGKLSHELQCGSVDLVLRRRRLEVEQRLDVAAHEKAPLLSPPGRTEDAESDISASIIPSELRGWRQYFRMARLGSARRDYAAMLACLPSSPAMPLHWGSPP